MRKTPPERNVPAAFGSQFQVFLILRSSLRGRKRIFGGIGVVLLQVFLAAAAARLKRGVEVEVVLPQIDDAARDVGAVVRDALQIRQDIRQDEARLNAAIAVFQTHDMVRAHPLLELVDDLLERLDLHGLIDAEVTFYPTHGGTAFMRNVGEDKDDWEVRTFAGQNIETEYDEKRGCYIARHVTGRLTICWQEKENIGDYKKLEFLRPQD